MVNIPDIFGCNVFNETMMKAKLPKNVYKNLRHTMEKGEALDTETADVVANAIKDWALALGATHYTHWFQPMTGSTAEKHDSFLSVGPNGTALMEFSGKALIKGEPDASSFPSGGLRQTSSARGYTAWDPTSYCFVKEGSLYIPTVFVSYTGETLDKKTPLLRSMEALSKSAVRFLKLFGNENVTRVTSTVGAEQEYFLIDKGKFDQRKDLVLTGRTLFGAKPPKRQELDDQYFANLKPRIAAYMADLDNELWKLGVYSHTKHNEAAPAQHEMAPIFTTSNLGADQNELAMEVMEKIALKHNLVCLLHEKPFEGVNGSGKHNNWSMRTNDGQNLLDPGDTPMENLQFLTILCALIKGVDEYADLMRLSAASAGNDHRLGADEAPPAIISMFLGEELDAVLQAIEEDGVYKTQAKSFEIGVNALPSFPKDSTDRNRTGRGYAHRVIFAGVQTPYKDVRGDYIYTGDAVMADGLGLSKEYINGVRPLDFYGDYGFKLDNHSLLFRECKKLVRVGTVFYNLSWEEEDMLHILEDRSREMHPLYGGGPTGEENLRHVRFTPNFFTEEWNYYAMEILRGEDFEWRK